MDKILEDLIQINIRLNEQFSKTVDILNDNIDLIAELKKDVDKIKGVNNEN